jgi:hypothetical protein
MRDRKLMPEAELLELHLAHEAELFLCADNSAHDSEWRLYEYDDEGAHQVVTYEVTDEAPPDGSIILKRWDSGKEFVVRYTVTVTERERD